MPTRTEKFTFVTLGPRVITVCRMRVRCSVVSDAGASLATLLSIALALLLVALALAFTPLLIAALFTLTLLLLISVALSLPLLLLVTPVLFPLALLLLVPLFALALLTLLISLPTFRLGPVLPSLGFALAFALPLTLSLSPLVLAGGLFPLAALLISALSALLRPSLVLTLTAVLCLASTFSLTSTCPSAGSSEWVQRSTRFLGASLHTIPVSAVIRPTSAKASCKARPPSHATATGTGRIATESENCTIIIAPDITGTNSKLWRRSCGARRAPQGQRSARHYQAWPKTRIVWRGHSHYGRVEAMEWAEDHSANERNSSHRFRKFWE